MEILLISPFLPLREIRILSVLEDLIEKGLLTRGECESCDWGGSESYVDYEKMYMSRYKLLRKAYERADLSKDED